MCVRWTFLDSGFHLGPIYYYFLKNYVYYYFLKNSQPYVLIPRYDEFFSLG